MRAPDYAEPITGWRIWDVVEQGGALRLRSPAFRTVWLPRRPVVAVCRRSLANLAWAGLSHHRAPHARCSCGLYAARTAELAALSLPRPSGRRRDVVHRVLGRVSLWGAVVEAMDGWRASSAYPSVVYVPSPTARLRAFLTGLPLPALPAEEIAIALAGYAVPVDVVGCATVRELVESVEGAERRR